MGDKARRDVGVVSSLAEGAEGEICLIMDDVNSDSVQSPQSWTTKSNYTSNAYDRQKLLSCKLTEREFADIGLVLVARLISQYKI